MKDAKDSNTDEKEDHEAATRIQANYRGYRTRKSQSTTKYKSIDSIDPANNEDSKMNEEAVRSQQSANFYLITFFVQSGTDPKNPQDVDKAATTIQAGFKGYKVRKDCKKQKSKDSSSNSPDGSPKKAAEGEGGAKEAEEEIVNKDSNE